MRFRFIPFAALLLATPAFAAPVPTAMPYDAIAKAWPGERPTFGTGRFSPDGSQIAFVAGQLAGASDQAWLYNLKTKQLVPVTVAPAKPGSTEIHHVTWSADGTLYIEVARDLQDGLGVKSIFVVVKGGKPSMIAAFPKDIADKFAADDKADAAFDDTFVRNYNNGTFTVTLQDVHHSDHQLRFKRKGSKKNVVIVNGGGELAGFLFDRQRSVVRYIDQSGNAIVSYDLATAKGQTLLSFGAKEANLLDQTADGALLAYETYGPCDATPQDAKSHYNVCFVSLAP